jgi:transglutaminase-like putative cysteine protease
MSLLRQAHRAVRTQALAGALLAALAGALEYAILLAVVLLAAPLILARRPRWVLPHWLVNVAVAVATVWLGWRVLEAHQPLARLAQIVIYLCILQMLRAFEKVSTPRDVGQTLVLSLIMVSIGSLCAWGLEFGVLLVVYLFLTGRSVVLLSVASGRAEAGVRQTDAEPTRTAGLGGAMSRAVLGVLGIALALFVLFPRHPDALWPIRPPSAAVSGFSEHLQLGEINRIQEDNTPVMRVWMAREGQSFGSPNIPLYLRGVTYDRYEKIGAVWQWRDSISQQRLADDQIRLDRERPGSLAPMEQCTVELMNFDTNVLFAPFPVSRVTVEPGTEGGDVLLRVYDSTLRYDPPPSTGRRRPRRLLGYTVRCPSAQPGQRSRMRREVAAALDRRRGKLLGSRRDDVMRGYRGTGLVTGGRQQVTIAVGERVRSFVRNTILPTGFRKTILPNGMVKESYEIAAKIARYLRGNYTYSLSFERRRPDQEPIEAFLYGSKDQGRHCEYFAAAMVALCRSEGLCARLVTGFRGGEWNGFDRSYLVRKKHAHSWVEVYVPPDPSDPAQPVVDWVRFDPTPAAEGAGGGWTDWLGQFFEYLRTAWRRTIDEYGASQQNWLRRWIGRYARGAGRWSNLQMERLEAWLGRYVGGAARVVGWVLLVLGVLVPVGVLTAVLTLARRRRSRRKKARAAATTRRAPPRQVAFYQRLLQLLARSGHTKPAAMTAREFLGHLARLEDPRLDTAAIGHVVRAYYRQRYGGRGPDEPTRQRIEQTLTRMADGDGGTKLPHR